MMNGAGFAMVCCNPHWGCLPFFHCYLHASWDGHIYEVIFARSCGLSVKKSKKVITLERVGMVNWWWCIWLQSAQCLGESWKTAFAWRWDDWKATDDWRAICTCLWPLSSFLQLLSQCLGPYGSEAAKPLRLQQLMGWNAVGTQPGCWADPRSEAIWLGLRSLSMRWCRWETRFFSFDQIVSVLGKTFEPRLMRFMVN